MSPRRHRPQDSCTTSRRSSLHRATVCTLTHTPAHTQTHRLQGVLAANIFDWGAKACVELYQSATILEMYREVRCGGAGGAGGGRSQHAERTQGGLPCEELVFEGALLTVPRPCCVARLAQARTRLSRRPWRVDDFDAFAEVWFSKSQLGPDGEGALGSETSGEGPACVAQLCGVAGRQARIPCCACQRLVGTHTPPTCRPATQPSSDQGGQPLPARHHVCGQCGR